MLETSLTSVEKKIDDLLASVEDPRKTHSMTSTEASGASAEQMMNGTIETKPGVAESRPDPREAEDKTGQELPIMGASKD
jgi:hypothetical protein